MKTVKIEKRFECDLVNEKGKKISLFLTQNEYKKLEKWIDNYEHQEKYN